MSRYDQNTFYALMKFSKNQSKLSFKKKILPLSLPAYAMDSQKDIFPGIFTSFSTVHLLRDQRS